MPSGSGASRSANSSPPSETPAFAKPKIGITRKATHGWRKCSIRSSGCDPSRARIGMVIAAATPASVAWTPDLRMNTHSTIASRM